MKKIILTTITALLLFSCQSDDTDPLDNPDAVVVDFDTVIKNEFSGEPLDAGEFIINTDAEWVQFTELANSVYNGQWEPLEGISIDFESHTAIVVLHDFFGNGGHFIEITSIDEAGGMINIMVDKSADIDGNATSVHCQPYHIVTIPKTTLPVAFEYN